jgi:recombination protein RecT
MSKTAVAEVRLQLDTMLAQFEAVLPKHIPVERFGRVVLSAIQNNPELLNVERRSLWNAAMRAAQDGLMPDGRLGAIVAYRDKRRGPIAQWLPMIAGIRQKVRNSGDVVTWEVHNVHEKDLWDYELGDHPHISHRPVRGDRGAIIASYSIAVMKGGEISREVMWIDEIEAIRELSRAGDSGPWKTHYGEMAKKTVARRHAKVLPMSTDLDDMLRQGDEDPAPIERAPGRNLTDALNMIASLPQGEAPPAEANQQLDLVDAVNAIEEVSHESDRKAG